MNKLWKHEWKYHIFFIVAVSVILVLSCDVRGWFPYLENYTEFVEYDSDLSYMCSDIIMAFLSKIIWIVLGGLLVKKSMIYWIEKNACGREFFQSLPIRKNERMRFHICMDVLLVLVSVVVYACYEYTVVRSGLELCQVEMPWLGSAYIGMTLVSVSFIWMLLGWIYLMESIWVSGSMKLLGFFGSLLMIYVVLRNMFHQLLNESKIMQTIYGFFSRESVAGNYYLLESGNSHSTGFQHQWVHDSLILPLLHKGEQIMFDTMRVTEEGWQYELEPLSRLYDFTHPTTYVYHVIGYLLIGVSLVVLAHWLSSKQELSKGTFYFDFGRYLFSGMIAVTFYVMISGVQSYDWQWIVNIAAAIVVFIVLMYILKSDRMPLLKRKERDVVAESNK